MKIENIEISETDFEAFKNIFQNPEIVKLRKVITLYKANDTSLAMFRVQAAKLVLKVSLKKFLKKPLNKKESDYLNVWLTDSNKMFVDYFECLDKLLINKSAK